MIAFDSELNIRDMEPQNPADLFPPTVGLD